MSWLQLARRELWQQRLPSGLLGLGYLWAEPDSPIAAHRQLWWQGGDRWPRWAWLLVQGWQWLRWVGWFGWLSTWEMVRRRGPAVAQREGIGLGQQGWRVLGLALGWCILPRESYRFGLYRRPGAALDYVYDRELPAYHRWRSAPLGPSAPALALLQDKLALAEHLHHLGLPTVPTLHGVAQGPPPRPLASYLEPGQTVFCKSRSTNQGRGAFTAQNTPAGLVGEGFAGEPLPTSDQVEAAWANLLALDDALLQPCLANHPALAAWAKGDRAITVRYISRWQGTEVVGLGATLEVPTGRVPSSDRILYTLLPLDLDSGRPRPWPSHSPLPPAAAAAAEDLWRRLPEDVCLPHWAALVAASHRAQQQFPSLWAIAWDWVITPAGPVLLEGNSGWGTAVPQCIHGGLLRPASPPD